MRVLMIRRAEVFSPNSIEKDGAILTAVANRLLQRGYEVKSVKEDDVLTTDRVWPDAVFTMGRWPATLDWLKGLYCARIINGPQGIENCARCQLELIMDRIGTPRPSKEGTDGYWIKRGDAAAQEKGDVSFAADQGELEACIEKMRLRGIDRYTVSAHVCGDLVKFYGVRGTGFFRHYYPTDDGVSKFGDEQRNGQARHYSFDVSDLQGKVEQLSEAVGVEVYGGDCIVRSDGTYCVIDFNDWPSFSRCREEAAEAIASLVKD